MGGVKGHTVQNSNGSGRAGRAYGWMLLLIIAFGALLYGVMTLHKLKEKRIYELVIQDKNLQLHSLRLHLQKEREFAKESKRKFGEMKSKIYSLENQKSELTGRILGLQSTISSLKEEHKAIESALDEKQHKINLMKERETHVNEQNSSGSFLAKVLSLKEAEIETLRTYLKLPIKNWDINFKYSNPPENSTTSTGFSQRDETGVSANKGNGGPLHTSNKTMDGANSKYGEDRRQTNNIATSREISAEAQPRMLKSSPQGFSNKSKTDGNHGKQTSYKSYKDNGGLGIETQKSNTSDTEAIAKSAVDIEKHRDIQIATVAANSSFRNNAPKKSRVGSIKGRRVFRDARNSKQKERPKEAKLLQGKILGLDIGTGSKSTSVDEVQVNRNINDKGTRVASDNRKKKPREIFNSEAQDNDNPQRTEVFSQDKAYDPEQTHAADKKAAIADWEVEDIHESDAHNSPQFSS